MHFSSDQATEMTEHVLQAPTPEMKVNPRVEHVKSLAKPPKGRWGVLYDQVGEIFILKITYYL